jgi:hypothetical protein
MKKNQSELDDLIFELNDASPHKYRLTNTEHPPTRKEFFIAVAVGAFLYMGIPLVAGIVVVISRALGH